MRYKSILITFFISLGIVIAARLTQLLIMIDPKTGFYYPMYGALASVIPTIMVFAAAASSASAYFTRRRPHKPPRGRWPLFVSTLLCALAFIYETISLTILHISGNKQDFLQILFSAMCAVFFFCYAIACRRRIDLPAVASLLPLPYFIYVLLADFINFKGMANISENILQIIMRCAVLAFVLLFAKITAYIGVGKSVRKVFAVGLTAALSAVACTVPRFIVILIGRSSLLHDASLPSFTVTAMALFITVFCLSLFSKNNLSRNRHRLINEDETSFNSHYYINDDKNYTESHTASLSNDVEEGPDDSTYMTE